MPEIGHCTPDLAGARKVAAATGRPLLIWVGGCDGWHDKLPDCIHARADEYGGSKVERVIVPTPTGAVYWEKKDLPLLTPQNFRDAIQGKLFAPVR